MTASFADSRPEHETMPTHKWLVAASVMLGAILTNLDASIVNVALPYMQKSFGVGVDRITWVVTSYLVAGNGVVPRAGSVSAGGGGQSSLVTPRVLVGSASTLCALVDGVDASVA